MSLLSTASPWNQDEPTNKKRPSNFRKTVRRNNTNTLENFSTKESYSPVNGENSNSTFDMRQKKINDLINKMTDVSSSNEDNLSQFTPLSPPESTTRKPDFSPEQLLPSTHYSSPTPSFSLSDEETVKSNDTHLGKLSDYQHSYNTPATTPYYAKMGLTSSNNTASGNDHKLMEKINYMIHLLEEQQREPTNHVKEEFVLYTFLGVFMIFVVDSFSKASRYVR